MSKYAPLQHFLEHAPRRAHIPMTFAEIETVIGRELPPSSRRHRAWWSNNPTNNVMTYAWLNAGYETADVDLAAERLVFRRVSMKGPDTPPTTTQAEPAAAAPDSGNPADEADGEPVVCRHPLFGALKGLITVEPGYDLTRSLFEDDWLEKRMEEKYRDL